MAPTRRRALPASEWKLVQKATATSGALSGGGIAQPIQGIPPGNLTGPDPKLPPVDDKSKADTLALLETKRAARKATKQVSTVAAFNTKGEMLWGKRHDNKRWTTPGGHHEPGEKPDEAAKRELYEESGLKPVKMEYLGHGMGGPNGDIKVHCFRADVEEGEPHSKNDPDNEVSEWKWTHPEMAPANLHNKNNVLLRLLGLQEGEVKKATGNGAGGVQDQIWLTRTETNGTPAAPITKGNDGVVTDPSNTAVQLVRTEPMEKGNDGQETDPSNVVPNTPKVQPMEKGGCSFCKKPATKAYTTGSPQGGPKTIAGCDLHSLNAVQAAEKANRVALLQATAANVKRTKALKPPPEPTPEQANDHAMETFWEDPSGMIKPEDAGTDIAQVDLRAHVDQPRCACEACAPMAAAPTHTQTAKDDTTPVLQPLEEDKGNADKTNAPVGAPSATQEAEAPTVRKFVSIMKALVNPDRRLVTGIVLQPEETDAQGDIYDAAVIEQAAHDFLAAYNRDSKSGYMHKEFGRDLQVVESWITPVPIHLDGKLIKKGTWMMTMRVMDNDAWAKVKAGQIRGFSIGGVAKVRPVAA